MDRMQSLIRAHSVLVTLMACHRAEHTDALMLVPASLWSRPSVPPAAPSTE